MNFDISTLPWLPPVPNDFRALCRALEAKADGWAPALRALAQAALSDTHLTTLSRTVVRLREKNSGKIPGLHPFKLGLVSNSTTKMITPSLVASALRYGVDLSVVEAEFNQVMQVAINPDSLIFATRPDAILLALDHYAYEDLRFGVSGDADGALAYFTDLRSGLRDHFKGALIFQTVACPSERLFGNLDVKLRQSQRARINHFNRDMIAAVANSSDVILDVDGLAQSLGTQSWFDCAQWHLAKLPFAQQYVPIYAEHCVRTIGAMIGKSRKCLVLDLDNTLWGGVIGDDGIDGIVLGHGSGEGEAFLAVQQMAIDLRARGVLLAVSSKNDDRIARNVFQKHPEMLLREEHISIFQANWNDKASNLEAIAAALNIGLDSLVFLDDNPAERRQVRQALPQVAVPELGEDPALYPLYLLAGGYFEAIAFLDEDRQRAEQYHANAKRSLLQNSTRDLTSYLNSLDMVMTITRFDKTGRSRIAQLINKSNQFNLTTRRYTESEIEYAGEDPNTLTFQVRLADSFGDNGMISVVIVRNVEEVWTIDTWLMSCRVLGRGVECAVLNELVGSVRQRGGSRLIGLYRRSERNEIVAGHYEKLGFSYIDAREDGSSAWSLDIANYMFKETAIKVVRENY